MKATLVREWLQEKLDARRFPDISRFWATVPRFGQSSKFKQNIDTRDNFTNAQGRIQ
jgi:hypothetical protein